MNRIIANNVPSNIRIAWNLFPYTITPQLGTLKMSVIERREALQEVRRALMAWAYQKLMNLPQLTE